ncbi:hypothetical protein OUZ56_011363 [Daphnia magna]|uniref:Uncharacterized protein n=1 Tax=Daphnia magna TaxID=35525 RepID=A0ABQ9YZX1_9CRUS|nr:hypothetical protein OUZ56_011363 [Daphnia magna]
MSFNASSLYRCQGNAQRQASIAWSVLCDCIVTAGVSNFRLRHDGVPRCVEPWLPALMQTSIGSNETTRRSQAAGRPKRTIRRREILDPSHVARHRSSVAANRSSACCLSSPEISKVNFLDIDGQQFYRAMTSKVYFINWSKPFFISVAMLCYASVAILHAFDPLSLYDKPKLSYRPPLLPVDGTKKRNFAGIIT